MATVPNQPTKTTSVAPAATTAYTSRTVKTTRSNVPRGNQTFLFDRSNYLWMAGGLVLILLGMMLMSGGKSADPHQFHPEEIYSTRRITIAPILILLGFAVEAYAIMKKKPAEAETADPLTP